MIQPGSEIVGEIPDFSQICSSGDEAFVTVRQPGIEGTKQVPIGGCLQLTAVRSGCEPGAPSTGTPINFVLGSTSTDVTGQSPLDPEPTLGHVIDNHLVSIPVNPGDQTQLLNQQGAPIEGCQSSSTVLVPLPAVLWQNLVSGSSKLSTNPYQPRPQVGQPQIPPLQRQGIFESLQCDQLLKPADPSRQATAQNILQASGPPVGDVPQVMSCTYKETCAPEGQARVQSHKLFEIRDGQGNTVDLGSGTVQNLIQAMGLQLVEGQQTITPKQRGGEGQTDARMVPAGQPLAIGEVIGNRTPTLGRWQYSYQPLASSTTVNGQPQSSGSFVPQAGRDYTVRYTNVLKREPAPPDPPKQVTRFPCLEISKSGCPGSPAQFQVKARGGLARVYGTQTFNMLANGGPHRFCPKRDELEGTPDQFQGSISIRELNAQAGSTIAVSAAGQPPSVSAAQQGLGQLNVSFQGTAGRQGDGGHAQPQLVPIAVTNPDCSPGRGENTRACVKFVKQWDGGVPLNGSSPQITLTGPGDSLRVSQESGLRCYDNLETGKTYPVSASEALPPQDSGNVAVKPQDQTTITPGQSVVPELVLVNKRTTQKCVTVTKTLESAANAPAQQQPFRVNLMVRTAAGQQSIPLDLKPGQSATRCFDDLNQFKADELEQPGSAFTHLRTMLNTNRIVADRGQPMGWRRPGNNTVSRLELVNVPRNQLTSQACVVVRKQWFKDGTLVQGANPLQQVTRGDSFQLISPGRTNSLLADLKSQGEAKVCRPMQPGEEWSVTVRERLQRLPKGWIPLPSATTSTNLTSATPQAIQAQVKPNGPYSEVRGLRVLPGNTEQVVLANQYREPVRVNRQDYCMRVNKSMVGPLPAGAQPVTLQFSQVSVPLQTLALGGRSVQKSTSSTNSAGEELHSLEQTLDLARGSITQPVCFTDQNFASGITLSEPSAAGSGATLSATLNGRQLKPNSNGALVFPKSLLRKGGVAEVELVNTYPEIPVQPFKPQVPALQTPTPQNPTPQGQTPQPGQTPPPTRNQPPTGTATPPSNRNQPPTGTTTPPVPVRHQRYDADTQTFVFVIPGQAPRFVELEDLPGVITVNGIRYRLLKPDVVRGL